MDRRQFLRSGLLASAGVALATPPGAYASTAVPGAGPYGPLGEPDANGIRLPAGFTSRRLATSLLPVALTGYVWHMFPDGGACFPAEDGGWVYVSNSEVPGGLGGAGALRFDAAGEVADAYSILTGTSTNCAGGPTPWGTWLSCEETAAGRVWECDPLGQRPAVVRPALGSFPHEAVAVDPVRQRLYLTEDEGDGRLYRFTPAAYPDLDAGVLEVLAAAADEGPVTWLRVPDPAAAATPTRQQVPASKPFDGGEGIWCEDGFVYFTTKGTNRVWLLDAATDRLAVLYDGEALDEPPLSGVDNVQVHRSGDVFVAEDGGSMHLCLITPDRVVARFLQVTEQDASELAGPAFDPSGTRLYLSSQRGGDVSQPGLPGSGFGVTYEITGPFRTGAAEPALGDEGAPAPFVPSTQPRLPPPRRGGGSVLAATGGGAGAAWGLGLLGAALALRQRATGDLLAR